MVTVTLRFSCHRVRFARRSAAFRRKSRSAYAASTGGVEEYESSQRGEIVAGSDGLRTGFCTGSFVGVGSEGTFPRSARSQAASDGVGGINAAVPMELAGEFAFVRVVALIHLVSVETQDASFGIRRGRDVGYHRIDEDVASFSAVPFIS